MPLGEGEMGGVGVIDPHRPRLLLDKADRVGGRLQDRPAPVDLVGVEDLVSERRARGRGGSRR